MTNVALAIGIILIVVLAVAGAFIIYRRSHTGGVALSTARVNPDYENINLYLKDTFGMGISSKTFGSYHEMLQFLMNGIDYPSYAEAVPAVLRFVSDNTPHC